jgi:hypothetical protein
MTIFFLPSSKHGICCNAPYSPQKCWPPDKLAIWIERGMRLLQQKVGYVTVTALLLEMEDQ